MARTERLFDIIQILRTASKPVLAAQIAETLEVSIRTVYRDIAHLQARQVPIYGETGVGYIMRAGYDLPPLSFDEDEAEAIILGLSMVARTGDGGLWKSAKAAARKLREVAPGVRHLIASSWGNDASDAGYTSLIRRAIRTETKLRLSYGDANGVRTDRTVWPLAMIYYCDNEVLVSWCELRGAIRHFRVDRMLGCALLADEFQGSGAAILSDWEEKQKALVVQTEQLL
ncbi:helix-turn-helix transcriptional regulator [Arenibacterium sp. CAU 1754]